MRYFAPFLFFFASALVTSACAPERTLDPDTFAPVRVGLVTSLTGTLGTDGPVWADAAEVAAAEINAAGGPLPGRPIELVLVDDETNPDNAERIATQLIDEENVVAIIGAAASSISLGMAAVASERQVPQISCCSTSDGLTAFNTARAVEDRYLFRTAPSDRLQARVVALAAQVLLCTRLVILHLDDAYGNPFGMEIERNFQDSPASELVMRIPFADEQASYITEVTRARDATPDCVALVAFPGSGGTIVRDWASLSGTSPVKWIGTDGVRAPGFIEEAGDPMLVDQFFGTSPVTDGATPEYNNFRDYFVASWGREPIPFSSNQYDAVAILSLAIALAGTTDGPAVRDAIRLVSAPPADRGIVRAGQLVEALAEVREGRDVNYQGGSGAVDFDMIGDVVASYEIWRYDAPPRVLCAQGGTTLPVGSFCRFQTFAAEELDP